MVQDFMFEKKLVVSHSCNEGSAREGVSNLEFANGRVDVVPKVVCSNLVGDASRRVNFPSSEASASG
jgi:hypothetical protein